MSRLDDFDQLSTDLRNTDTAHAKIEFTTLFRRGCALLDFDDGDAAKVFDTSRPNVNRWRRGKVVPPSAALVLKVLRDVVGAKIVKLKRMNQINVGESRGFEAPIQMIAKGR